MYQQNKSKKMIRTERGTPDPCIYSQNVGITPKMVAVSTVEEMVAGRGRVSWSVLSSGSLRVSLVQ